MVFGKLFAPKWKHADPRVRAEAVPSLKDQAVLATLAEHDAAVEVRMAAIRRLTDQEVLTRIVQNDADRRIRYAALENVHDDRVIADFSLADTGGMFPELIVKRLQDQTQLARIAAEHPVESARYEALTKLKDDQEVLTNAALNEPSWLLRVTAMERVTDQPNLVRIAEKHDDLLSRTMEKIQDQGFFERIARTHKERTLRAQAARRISAQDLLADIAEKDPDDIVRETIVNMLTDKVLAERLAREADLTPCIVCQRWLRARMGMNTIGYKGRRFANCNNSCGGQPNRPAIPTADVHAIMDRMPEQQRSRSLVP